MLKRRLTFSIIFFIVSLISILYLDKQWIFLILMPAIPFLFYLINIFDLKIPAEYEMIFLLMITFGTVLGELWDLYYRIIHLDTILHCLSGPILCLFPMCILVRCKTEVPFKSRLFLILFVSMGFAAMWEIYEFTMDELFGLDMQKDHEAGLGLIDTMHDLWIHFIGAAGFLIFMIVDNLKFKSKYTKKLEDIMSRETNERQKKPKKIKESNTTEVVEEN